MSSVTSSFSSAPPSATDTRDPPPFFASGTSPPIIIGFIAIGGFSAFILVLCVWRKVTGRDLLDRQRRRVVLAAEAEKPQLYDVWADGRNVKDFKWKDAQPFSISVLSETAHMPAEHAPTTTWRSRWKPKAKSTLLREPTPTHEPASLQVAVLLAMPSQHEPDCTDSELAASSSAGAQSHRSEELVIGLVEVPWTVDVQAITGAVR
ncbi:hypothetical protein FA95DRAFT_1608064 [Auriscalpium vulgare]|uniref:Uncharacterized protein n=1 Tax=Auriscalpium vulgare TaxID=40419 RepID=A0ACB8RLF5_9AGAM|nr:hypothetical protein FA95DRAFT_1608064 [Auriscalpium vulgare]